MANKNKTNYDIDDGMLIPEKVNNIRKGNIIMLNGHPCKVVEIKKSKPGKHGSAKTHFVGLDVFTSKKHEEILREEAQLVTNSKQDYLLSKIEGSKVILSTLNGAAVEGTWAVPTNDLGDEIKEMFEGGIALRVTVLSALGKEQIVSYVKAKTQ